MCDPPQEEEANHEDPESNPGQPESQSPPAHTPRPKRNREHFATIRTASLVTPGLGGGGAPQGCWLGCFRLVGPHRENVSFCLKQFIFNSGGFSIRDLIDCTWPRLTQSASNTINGLFNRSCKPLSATFRTGLAKTLYTICIPLLKPLST